MALAGVDPEAMMQLLRNDSGVRQPSFGQRLATGAQSFMGNRDLALALLANSGNRGSFGQIFGQSALQAQQMGVDRQDQEFKRQLMQAQLANLQGKNNQPNSVREYEYAKQGGFKGSFQDWIVAGGQSSRPSSVQEWEFYNALPQDQKPMYLEMKRNPNFTVKDVNQVPTSIQQSIVGGVNTRPLSTLPQTVAATAAVKQAEGAAGALGKTQGEIAGGIQKKGSDAQNVLGMITEADKLIDDSTGSMVGAGVDVAAGAVGKSTKGAQAIARLRVIQAGLMTSMPRMEGPQSDRDVELYRQAAAQLGDATIPRETRKAALKTVRDLQLKYAERAQQQGITLFPAGSAEDTQVKMQELNSLLDKYAPQ